MVVVVVDRLVVEATSVGVIVLVTVFVIVEAGALFPLELIQTGAPE